MAFRKSKNVDSDPEFSPAPPREEHPDTARRAKMSGKELVAELIEELATMQVRNQTVVPVSWLIARLEATQH